MVINLSEQYSLLNDWVAEMRDVEVQADRMRFRRNLERIGEVAALEISKKLPTTTREIQTPLGISACNVLEGTAGAGHHSAGRTTPAPGSFKLFR